MTIYKVNPGDTLAAISRRYGLTPEALARANSLRTPDALPPGLALVIPVERVTYTLRRGDSVYAVARAYGLSPAAVLAANPAAAGRVYPGQTLILPFPNERLGTLAVNGYVTRATEATLRESLPYLTWLSPAFARTDAAGVLTTDVAVDVDPELSDDYGVGRLLTLTNQKPDGGFDRAAAHGVLTDAEAQDRFLENTLDLLDGGDWQGVNVDFEYVPPYDRGSYNQFLRRLGDALHARGYLLTTALAPKTRPDQPGLLYEAHDYPAHGQVADYVVLMTYEWGYSRGPAMAVSPLDQVRRVLDYAVSVMPAGKILMGVPNYGYDWTLPFVQGTVARGLTNSGAVTLAGAVGAEIQFDPAAQSPFFRYTDAAGRRHEVWFEDPRSLAAKYRLAAEYGLAGVSFWNLNSLYRPGFVVLEGMFAVERGV